MQPECCAVQEPDAQRADGLHLLPLENFARLRQRKAARIATSELD